MPVRSVQEIMRTGPNGPVHIGLVTDGFLAQQVIDRLYAQLRQVVLSPNSLELLGAAGFEAYDIQDAASDWDTWSINNKNSTTPVFWSRPRLLWNSVPSTFNNWLMSELGDEFSMFPGDSPNVLAELPPKP